MLAFAAIALIVGVALGTHVWVHGTPNHPRDSARVWGTPRAWIPRAGVAACAIACLVFFFAREALAPVLGVQTLQRGFLLCIGIGIAIVYGALPPQRDL